MSNKITTWTRQRREEPDGNNTTWTRQRREISAISLFSGIGAFELAAKLVFGDCYQTFQFVEINPDAQKVLRSQFPNIPIWPDIKTYRVPEPGFFSETITVLAAGFPCTDTSSAGKRKGLTGNESGLWWEMYRIVVEFQPDFVLIENPEGIIHRGLRTVLGGLGLAGYQTEVELVSAAELGAPHRRSRVFVVAYAHHLFMRKRQEWCCWSDQIGTQIARARALGYEAETKPKAVPVDDGIPRSLAGLSYSGWWEENVPPTESGLVSRTPGRREAINLIGRSIVPLQAAVPMMRLEYLVSML